MTIANEPTSESHAPVDEIASQQEHSHERQPSTPTNVGGSERAVSVAAGSLLTLLGLSRRSLPGLLIASIGGGLVYRGTTGHCPMYEKMGLDTSREKTGDDVEKEVAESGIHVESAFLINRSAEDLYNFWRNFENLPKIMTHLKSVTASENGHTHWIATAPWIVGGKAEWDAEITADEPNRRIAWRSLPGSQVESVGKIRFSKAMGDRGTDVHVYMDYLPPAGKLGHWVATLFGEAPRRQMRDDLRNFQRLMETGEIATVEGQSRGTCTGQGKREGQ